MAGRIRSEDVQAVQERTDIVQVVSQYLQLKKTGRDSLSGLCPFHTEKTASFSVSPSKQVYYCFGCGEGGTVFSFLQKIESLSFPEAVERLAGPVGVTLRHEGQTASDRRVAGQRNVLHRVNAEAGSLFHHMLRTGREAADARAYLAARGISEASIEKFGIGYAPGYSDFLLKRLTRTYSAELLVEAGVVTKDERGTLRDRFRGRVVFPIHDLSGNAVGFGGRLLAGPQAPPNAAKYVNSPETTVYHKGTLLYNLNRAKADITRTGRAFLVEGYTDVIALDQAGITTAVATCGTALGEDHIRLLARFGEKVVLSFDSDEAGARAAERAYQFHERYPVDLSVLLLPEGQDPADFALANGAEAGAAFGRAVEGAVPLVRYMIERSLKGRSLADIEERNRAVNTGLALVAGLEDPVRRQEYARVLAGLVGEPEMSVMLQLERLLTAQFEGGAGARRAPDRSAPRSRMPAFQKVEREALKLLLQEPQLCGSRVSDVDPDRFSTPGYRAAFDLLRDTHAHAGNGAGNGTSNPNGGSSPTGHTVASLVASAQDRPRGDQLAKLVAALAVEPAETIGEVTQAYADRVFLRLEELALKRQAEEIRKRLERLNPLTAPDEHRELFAEFAKVEGARRKIREEL
jgi:DNA primase